MKVTSTKNYSDDRLKILVYSPPGVGKTTLAKTIKEKVLIVSAEAGLLSLKGIDIDVFDLTVDENGKVVPKEQRVPRLFTLYNWLMTDEARKKYKWIFIDSLTEISQNLVEQLLLVYPDPKDGLKMWGDYAIKSRALVKTFRDLPGYHVVFTALEIEDKDENNRRYIRPDMQGKTGKQLAAFFDEVFHYEIDADGKRMLLTQPRENVVAKDRSGALCIHELPDLWKIVEKIRGTVTTNQLKAETQKLTNSKKDGTNARPNRRDRTNL